MDFTEPPRTARASNLLPMINVVFLLLIFFLISAKLTPPEPFPVSPPQAAERDQSDGEFSLYVGGTGALGFRDVVAEKPDAATSDTETGTAGEARVLAALKAAREAWCATQDCAATPPTLVLHADAKLPVPTLARLVRRLGGLGFAKVALRTQPVGTEGP
ncbi:biopolymer transporter ExbD [Thioclava sp. BHET1]|nr:biopolymer transporter ExbD [Thioclava sp. BHET1]